MRRRSSAARSGVRPSWSVTQLRSSAVVRWSPIDEGTDAIGSARDASRAGPHESGQYGRERESRYSLTEKLSRSEGRCAVYSSAAVHRPVELVGVRFA